MDQFLFWTALHQTVLVVMWASPSFLSSHQNCSQTSSALLDPVVTWTPSDNRFSKSPFNWSSLGYIQLSSSFWGLPLLLSTSNSLVANCNCCDKNVVVDILRVAENAAAMMLNMVSMYTECFLYPSTQFWNPQDRWNINFQEKTGSKIV